MSKQMQSFQSSIWTLSSDELKCQRKQYLHGDVSELTTYSFKPQLKDTWPQISVRHINAMSSEILAGLDGQAAMAEIKRKRKSYDHSRRKRGSALEKDDLLIEAAQMEGYISDSDHGITVVLGYKPDTGTYRGRICP